MVPDFKFGWHLTLIEMWCIIYFIILCNVPWHVDVIDFLIFITLLSSLENINVKDYEMDVYGGMQLCGSMCVKNESFCINNFV